MGTINSYMLTGTIQMSPIPPPPPHIPVMCVVVYAADLIKKNLGWLVLASEKEDYFKKCFNVCIMFNEQCFSVFCGHVNAVPDV